MKRLGPVLILPFLVALLNGGLTGPARADCGVEVQAVRVQLASVKDQSRRQELQKLVEKAEKDGKAGRANLCDQAVQRARTLLK